MTLVVERKQVGRGGVEWGVGWAMSEGLTQRPPWALVFQPEKGGHFRLVCAGLCSALSDPVFQEQGSPVEEEEPWGPMGVRPELGLAGGHGFV